MRAFLVACLLAGCYQPATESCYYRCAAGANPCPSGLECSAASGMCVTPGGSCTGPVIDAVVVDSIEADAPPPACGNGTATRGEICYATPQMFVLTTPPFDGVLADRDGDGDLDLVYMVEGNNGGFRQHVNPGTSLPPQSITAPLLPNTQVMRATNLDLLASSEFIAIDSDGISTLSWGPNNVLAEVSNYVRTGTVRQLLVGNITPGPRPNLAVFSQNTVEVLSYDTSLRLTATGVTTFPGNMVANDVAIGRHDADQLADLAIASNNGIGTMPADGTGLFGAVRPTSVTTPVHAIEMGDVDGDMELDIVFVALDPSNPNAGLFGILHGRGDGTFGPAVTLPLASAAAALDVRDIDGDNRADIIAVRGGTQRALAISLGRNDRQIEPPVFVSLEGSSAQISVRGSFNGDAVPDIVVTDRATSRVFVYPSNP